MIDTLLVNCPRCGAWPMAANFSSDLAQSGQKFRCPRCRHEEGGRLRRAGRVKPSSKNPEYPAASYHNAMKIRSHSESHIVELDDGSRWQIFPGDIDLTLNWKPETELVVVPIEVEVNSHRLIGGGAKVRVIAAGESWPAREVKSALKDG